MDLDSRPILVFWETTKACPLACRHCRAQALTKPLPGELTTEEGRALIDQMAEFGSPAPVLIFTGGDPLMRPDLVELVSYANSRGLRVGAAPAVSELLNRSEVERLAAAGLRSVSVSLDGATAMTHDWVRNRAGHFGETVNAIRMLAASGLEVQVNSLVFRGNVEEVPGVISLARSLGVRTLEFFYLIKVGRAVEGMEELSPAEYEDLSAFLLYATRYCVNVRTVEGPFIRRLAATGGATRAGALYNMLVDRSKQLMGEPTCDQKFQAAGTRDGKGVIFVAYNGDVYPSGFLPIPLGNVRGERLADIYRGSRLLRAIREAEFRGRCGICEFRDMCGGSRSRAFSELGDPLGEDPACVYAPRAALRALSKS